MSRWQALLLSCAALAASASPSAGANAGAGAAGILRPAPALPDVPAPMATDRVLVVAPHPDDETLCCAGYLQKAQQAGAAVGIVWVTAGDSFEIDAIVTERTLRPKGRRLEQLGTRRMLEAHEAATVLGVPRANQYLLGFPDRGIEALLSDDGTRIHRSIYTRAQAVPYAQAVSPGSVYSGDNLRRDLAAVIDQFSPTIVLVAAPEDRHSDHSASGALTRELLALHQPKVRVYYWIVHAGLNWPWPHGLHPTRPLLPPARAASLNWEQLVLDEFTVQRKLQALRQHRSQLAVIGWFLDSFVRDNELFAPAP